MLAHCIILVYLYEFSGNSLMKANKTLVKLFYCLLLILPSSTQTDQAAMVLGTLGAQISIETLSSPSDPNSDIPWSGGTNGVADIQSAFNSARSAENSQLGTSIPMMALPSQSEWDGMSDGEKALWLINRERIDRDIMPIYGLETNIMGVSQSYADYLLYHDAWGHSEDGNSPWERLNNNATIGACHDFLPIAENLAVLVTTASFVPLPLERTIYMWMYEDRGSNWGHRHAILWSPYNDNSGPIGREGFLGIGRANGGPYKGPFSQPWPTAEIIVMNVFDPCSTWTYPVPHVSSITRLITNPTIAAEVGFFVVFSEPVLGVDITDFSITTAGVTGALISDVSGSENIYTVNVDTGTGFGTIRLDLIDDDSIVNSSGVPLGDIGTGNGNYEGEIYDTATFVDVPTNYWASIYVESIYLAGITSGCGTEIFCPDDAVTRAQMAVFLERGIHGSAFTAPVVPVSFNDMSGHWAQYWIEALKTDGITGGCGAGIYCPDDPVTRAQMAVFLLRSKHGAGYTPPAAIGTMFADVPAGYWAAGWIEQLAAEGITGGCSSDTYCPDDPVTRAQMAVFLQRTFELPMP